MKRIALFFTVAGLSLLAPTAIHAADAYPSKPLRMVITFPAGGPTDVVVRMITQRLTEKWGHHVVIDNRGGAGGIVGTEIVARAAPDGYTFLVGTAGGMTINPAMHARLPYDSFRDFAPVGMLVVNPPWQFDSEARLWQEELHQLLGGSGGGTVRWLIHE